MAVDLQQVVAVIWPALGLGPVPAGLGNSIDFELEETTCVLERSPSGQEVRMSMQIGALPADPFTAADQLRRLLRMTLGLSMVNRATIAPQSKPDDAALMAMQQGQSRGQGMVFDAVGIMNSAYARDIIDVLRDVVQMRNLAQQFLTAGANASASRDGRADPPASMRSPSDDTGGDYMIFQP